jgi:hypothetical protein
MIDALLVVMSRPLDNRDDDFNDWYSNIHIRDALRMRGSIATQRFSLNAKRPAGYNNPLGWKYLALYEVADAHRFVREHIETSGTVRQRITTSFDISVIHDYHFFPLAFRDADPGAKTDGGVVLEQIRAKPGSEAAFRDWYEDEYMRGVARRPGVKSATLLAYRPQGQMLPTDPDMNFTAVYRLSDAAAMEAWQGRSALVDSPLIDAERTAVSCWDVLIPRLTKDLVLHPTSEVLASEERARAHMGEDFRKVASGKISAR